MPPLLAYFIASYIKKYIFDLDVDFTTELSSIQHPVVKEIPNHIKVFNAKGLDEKKDKYRQISMFD